MAPSRRQRYGIPERFTNVECGRVSGGADRVTTVKVRWRGAGVREETWEPVEHFSEAEFNRLFEEFGLVWQPRAPAGWVKSPGMLNADALIEIETPKLEQTLLRAGLTIQPSRVHGYGLMATKAIAANKDIFELTGMIRFEAEPSESVFWSFRLPLRGRCKLFFTPALCCPVNFINSPPRHRAANCFVRFDTNGTLLLTTLADSVIHAGTELLLEYPTGFPYNIQPSPYFGVIAEAIFRGHVKMD